MEAHLSRSLRPGGKKPASVCHCINIRRFASLVSQLYDQYLAPAGLTISQYSLLANLDALSTASISRLAAQTGLERTTVLRNLKPLMERGWVEDLSRPGKRDRVLHLTPDGARCLEEARPLWAAAQEAFAQKAGADTAHLIPRLLEQWQQ